MLGAHGLKGALRIRLDNPDSQTLSAGRAVYLELGGIAHDYQIISVGRGGHGSARLVLKGVDDASAAEALRGATLSVAQSALPPLNSGEFYYRDLVGCEVAATDGRYLGRIEEIFSTAANDVWVVRDGAREILVPVIEDVVKSIDTAARRVVLETVPGLLDE